jgi:hypothetical protein
VFDELSKRRLLIKMVWSYAGGDRGIINNGKPHRMRYPPEKSLMSGKEIRKKKRNFKKNYTGGVN